MTRKKKSLCKVDLHGKIKYIMTTITEKVLCELTTVNQLLMPLLDLLRVH